MEKRYQVFVSSTFKDLEEERQEVMHALLELECIPSGMELFPAANETQWNLIKKVIDDCDYYLLIVGGRYGSIGPEGISYTEMEYRYALEKGKPTITFIHKDPGKIIADKTESSPEGKEKLQASRTSVEKKLCKYWVSPQDLGSVVSRSLIQLIRSTPAVGWIRATGLASSELLTDLNTLRKENEELRSKTKLLEHQNQPVVENIAGMDEKVQLYGVYRETRHQLEQSWKCSLTWNQIFSLLSPYLLEKPSNGLMKIYLTRSALEYLKIKSQESSINDQVFQTIKIQFMAYGLITVPYLETTNGQMALFWNITNKGESLMMKLRSIRKSSDM